MNGLNNVSAEFEFAVLCCRVAVDMLTGGRQPDRAIVSRIPEIAGRIDGDSTARERVVELCRRHQVGPLVYAAIRGISHGVAGPGKAAAESCAAPARTDGLLADLEGLYYASAARNLRLGREVFRISEIFRSNGLVALPFKGPVLAERLYGDPAVRPATDIDFIVREADLARAKEELEKDGFRCLQDMSAAEDRIWRAAGWGYDMHRADRDLTVDIAAGASPDYLPFRMSSGRVFELTEEAVVNGQRLRVLSPEMELIFLCRHGAKHMWDRLIWVADIHALCISGKVDLAEAGLLAGESGTRMMLGTGLRVAHDVFDTPVPAQSMAGLGAEARIADTAGACLRRLLSHEGSGNGWLREQVFYLRMRETSRERFSYACLTLVRPSISDCRALPLPSWMFFLYYFIRPVRLMIKVLGRLGGWKAGKLE